MTRESNARELTLVVLASIILLFCGPYLVVKFRRPFQPHLYGELFNVNVGSGEPALIGESRLPTNWIRQQLGWETTNLLNQIFFAPRERLIC